MPHLSRETALDNTRCVQILFAAMGHLSPAGNADVLHETRCELAKLIVTVVCS